MANNLKGTFTNGHSILGQMRAESRRQRSAEPVETPEAKAERLAALRASVHAADAAAGRKPWNPQPRNRSR